MNGEQFENAVVALLQPLNAQGFVVSAMPDNLAQLPQQRNGGRIYVYYDESTYDDSQSMDLIAQNERVHIFLICTNHKRRGVGGLYDMIEKAKKLVIGKRDEAEMLKRFRLVSDKSAVPMGFEDNLWHRVVTLATDTEFLQTFTDEQISPNMSGIAFEGGLTE